MGRLRVQLAVSADELELVLARPMDKDVLWLEYRVRR